ncbi:hypothetical protein E4L95_22465 [Paracoccus liaowanqingii]|uniref:Uncharacterized protein n=1 Tax=Paracoccus liaowanqingii TaxID=2560053 RepID=A0A4Z1BZS9_9RHOB|nr:hypothetical protein E4L95_22465 [Paracoccus liaowanqingii]
MRRAFAARGHDVWSCDLLADEDGSNRRVRGDAVQYPSSHANIATPSLVRAANSPLWKFLKLISFHEIPDVLL